MSYKNRAFVTSVNRFKTFDPTLYKKSYYKGARVWVPHPSLVWEPAEVTVDYSSKVLYLEFPDGRKQDIKIGKDEDLPPLRNPDILLGENDLTSLSYLHEPAVLHNLKYRFCTHSTIYTYCGIVLVAINPYEELHIYDNDTIWTYRGKSQGELVPHIFAVAEEAYTRIEREARDQSIIVSGESGAGKTVSAKYVMRYFATVGGSSQETQVEKKVLSSSPIMEAIGNAKTTRNDNSSRFGKFIEIKFNKIFHIVGASMRTYLLEKSRVVFQAPGERNYHIFYQICAARNKLPHLLLAHQNEFSFLNQGESPHVDGVDDLKAFEETMQAFNTLGFSQENQDHMLIILASILHLGNVKISPDGEGSAIRKDDKTLAIVSQLLALNESELRHWLCNRQIISTRDVVNKPMSVNEANAAREALSKHMYSTLFNWIVKIINTALSNANEKFERFIGVLDIYGFETFEINSFEQFCINYANEKLQQQFNQHVFKLEQEEYLKEGIEWKLIDFYDNQPCIDLIESKLGILDLLDEECRMPNGSDHSWVEKLYKTCSTKHKHFSKPRFGTSSFVIHHFADNVEYQVDGFLDKNRDSVIEEQITVLRNSKISFVRKLFADEDTQQHLNVPSSGRVKIIPTSRAGAMPTQQKHNKRTVGSQFRDSLNLLMATLNATTPHYVRCIKPNDTKTPFSYNPQRAVQQLRACGVLETIRISAAGFPSRWAYIDFFLRYRVLCRHKDIDRKDIKTTCQRVLSTHIKDSEKYQFGKSKIFFRAGQVAFLEKLRADKLRQCCIMIQKNIRAFIYRKKFCAIQKSIRLLQRYSRGLLARRHAHYLRQTKAAITIQRYTRGWVKHHQYRQLRKNILGLQAHIRGLLARKKFLQMRYNHSAIVIQRFVRGWLARRKHAINVRRVVICQSAVRRFLARRKLRALRKEARSVEHVKKLNKGLENKIISLQQKIEEMTKTMVQLRGLDVEVNELRSKLSDFKHLEMDNKKFEALIKERDNEVKLLRERVVKEEDEKMDLISEKMSLMENLRLFEEQKNALQKEIDRLNEQLSNSQELALKTLQSRLEQERQMLLDEHNAQLENYQKLLADNAHLEQRNECLEQQLANLMGSHFRTPSNTSTISSHTDFENEDVGYGSHKSFVRPGNNNTADLDIGLVLQLQQKLKKVEKERDMLYEKIETLEHEESPTEERKRFVDTFKMEQLEMENEKLKNNLNVLRDSLGTGDPGTKELLNQFKESEWELDRRRDEIIQLRALLASQTKGLQNIAKINYGSSTDISLDVINEDGELVTAFEAQKRINRQLEKELQEEKNRRRVDNDELRAEIQRLKEDNDCKQRILSANLNDNTSQRSQSEIYMQQEISRLTSDHLVLQEKFDSTQEVLRKLKKQNKILVRKLKELGVSMESLEDTGTKIKSSAFTTNSTTAAAPNVVIKKDRNYQGMFEYRREDEEIIIKHLITGLRPKVAVKLLPCLPAYIFFMCIRHTDFLNDDEKVRSLLSSFLNSVKKLVKAKLNDMDYEVLWLSNTVRLLHTLKQYSGDKAFQTENTPRQNEQCLNNFDLIQYRQVLSDLAVWIYQGLIRDMEERIQNTVVGAILENEMINGLSRGPVRHRSASLSADSGDNNNPRKALDFLISELTQYHRIFVAFGVDSDLIVQIFRQIFYFISASSLNNLLLRKDLCHWTRGMQIRFNLSYLEQWARDENLTDPSIVNTLQPIIQASQLLQARKMDDDVQSLCDMCNQLTMQRILKLLHLYTPTDESERVQSSFINKMQVELQRRKDRPASKDAGNMLDQQLMMDTKFLFNVHFKFKPSSIRLEDIEIPEVLNLPMLKKV